VRRRLFAAALLAASSSLYAAVPGAPTSLTLTQVDPSGVSLNVSLAWVPPNNNTGSAITSYQVMRFSAGAFDFAWQIPASTCCTVSLPVKGNGIPTTFSVAATTALGTGPSVSATITTVSPTPVPGAAPVLSVTSRTSERVDLSWTPVTGAVTSYQVAYSTDPTIPTGSAGIGAGLNTTYYFPIGCYTYYIRVLATSTAGNSPWSNVVRSDCPCTGPPVGSTGLTVTVSNPANCSNGVDLKWTAPTTPAGCTISSYTVDITQNGASAGSYGAGLATTAHLPIQAGVTYTWAVRAVNARGTGAQSNVVTTTCVPSTPVPPTPTPIGGVWSLIGGPNQNLASVSAGSTSNFAAVDNSGYLLHWLGSNWAYDATWVPMAQSSKGSDGSWWGVKTDGSIYSFNGSSWIKMPGALKQVSVASATNVWGVNSANNVYRWNGTAWAQMPGTLTWVSAASDGSVWGITSATGIVRWNGSGWLAMPGAATQVAVGSAGNVWVLNSQGVVYRWNGTGWDPITGAGTCKSITAAADGTVLTIRPDSNTYRKGPN
jgi:hypothetical protein